MKKTTLNSLLTLAGCFAASICTPTLQAQTTNIWDFDYTGSIVQWTVPTSGIYDITAYGAQGGQYYTNGGGLGAQIGGSFQLIAGDVLSLLAGGQPSMSTVNYGAAGGGGSFVVLGANNTPLAVAGGGGGSASYNYIYTQLNATTSTTGNNAYYYGANEQGSGGTDGNGGTIGSESYEFGGAGGGGFYTDGWTHYVTEGRSEGQPLASGGSSYLQGGGGGSTDNTYSPYGGFGGGGQAYNGGGGGGGWSGGGGGYAISSGGGGGGGGGSFLAASGSNVVMTIGNTGNGSVSIAQGMASLLVGYNSSDQSTTISSGTNDYYNIVLGSNVGDTNNSLTVTNAGTVANAANNILVGQNGSDNTMTVSGGASVVNLGSSVIGLNATASGNSVLVTGTGSTWSSGTALLIGSSGSGNSMSVQAGADVASAGSGVALGYNAGSSGNSLLINGVGSTLADSADFVVGFSGSSNSVVVSNGGSLTNGQHSYGGVIGLNSGANNNSVLVSGSGSAWNNSGDLTIGNSGQGTLTVANGGSFSANAVIIASQFGSSGTLNFGSSGGSDTAGNFVVPAISLGLGNGTINFNQTDTVAVTVSGSGYINQSGSGTTILTAGTSTLPSGAFLQTTINGGSLVASGVFSSALLNISQGNFTLTGEGSTWSTSSTTPQHIWVGNSHPGNSAVISNGASMQASLTIGQTINSSNNSVVVTGAGSSWNAGNTGLNVGVNGSGNSMTISDGGNVSVAGGAIGLNSGANNNSVLVTGSGSAWILGNLTIGQAGGGNLTLANGGMATSTEITVASQSGSSGTLNVGRFGTNDAAGTINAPKITFGAGTGTINFNQSNATTISAVISGSGTVNQLGSGTTTLSANNTYTGTTTVTGGLLNVNGSVGSVTVSSGGSLGGSGTTGSLLVNGTLTPGNSPGTLNTGSQTWFNGANYNWQIFNATGSAGSGYDLLNISGSLDLSNLTAGGFGINMWSLSGINPDVNGNATNFNAANNYSWILAQAAAGITGFEATDFSIFTSAANGTAGFSNTLDGALSIAVDGNNLVLNYQAVPEPSTYTLLGLGVVGMLITLRRRARAKVG